MFFRGYVITKDKKCIEKFKNVENLHTLEEVKNLREYAGILAADSILVDVDDMKQSNLLLNIVKREQLKCRVLQSRKGMHFLFKNSKVEKCYTATKIACGLTVDIKSGKKNCYEVLKIDGKEREVLYDAGEYEELPYYLYPLKCENNFIGIREGQGRNQLLFNYILTLQSYKFSRDEIKNILRIINYYIFRQALPESELDTICREEAFAENVRPAQDIPNFMYEGKFLHDKFAEFMKDKYNIIKIDGNLSFYYNGLYVQDDTLLKGHMIDLKKNLKNTQRMEVLNYLKDSIKEDTPLAESKYIAFKNGVLDIETGRLEGLNKNFIFTNKIEHNYNANAESKTVDELLDKISCNDKQIRQLLEECVGSCFYRSNTLGGGKAFLFTGSGSNGKSTFLTMIRQVLGKKNYSSIDLKDLTTKFQNAEIYGKLANLGDDISSEYIVDSSIFKKFVTGETVQVQRKGERPFEFENYAKLVFSANEIPRIRDKTDGLLRRLLIIPFNAKFSKTDADYNPRISEEIKSEECIEYLIKLGVKALKRVLENKGYTESEQTKAELLEYEMENDPIKQFIHECKEQDFEIVGQETRVVFKKYSVFCAENGYKEMNAVHFSRAVCKVLNLESILKKILGHPLRIFIQKR